MKSRVGNTLRIYRVHHSNWCVCVMRPGRLEVVYTTDENIYREHDVGWRNPVTSLFKKEDGR